MSNIKDQKERLENVPSKDVRYRLKEMEAHYHSFIISVKLTFILTDTSEFNSM